MVDMGFFYFDESIHSSAGFVLGAWVACQTDPTERVNEALLRAGLRPGLDEFKSGARMLGNPSMVRAREELHDVVRQCRVGVVVVPVDRRQDVGIEAVRGLHKILSFTGLGISGHAVFLDQGLVPSRLGFNGLLGELGLSGNSIQIEQDSVLVPGLQLADTVAHTCATMLLAQMGLVTKRVKAGDNSGYEPDDDVDLAFMLWAGLRWNFFGAPPPPPQEWDSQLDWQIDVDSRGLFIAASCSEKLAAKTRERFAKMYLGCIH
jgi:hypothetical protein